MSEEKREKHYGDLLGELDGPLPNVADVLRRSQENRTAILNLRAKGVRLAGLDEWLGYLDELKAEFGDKRLEALRFLVERIRLNFETAIEATLAGLPSVVFDSMRDVME